MTQTKSQYKDPYITKSAYLATESVSDIRHEYINGDVYAMAGASENHGKICTNLTVILGTHFRERNCDVFASDMKLSIESRNCYYYPDLMVTCDERDRGRDLKEYPLLIIEILSKSTQNIDLGKKLSDYQQIETLQEYIAISQTQPLIICYRRMDGKLWLVQTYTKPTDNRVRLESIELEIELDEIYRKIVL
jgi:Uma2 family endonuclease